MKISPEDRQRLRDAVNADVKDDGARIMLHRAINAYQTDDDDPKLVTKDTAPPRSTETP